MRKIVRLCMLGAVVVMSPSTTVLAAKTASTSMPRALQGIWFVPEAGISKGCERYLALPPQAEPDERINSLVSSIVIAPKLIHSVAEYGEGNFYALKRVVKSGKNAWQISAAVTFDTQGDDGEAPKMTTLTLALNGNRLTITETGGKDGPYVTSGLVKCTAKLPTGY